MSDPKSEGAQLGSESGEPEPNAEETAAQQPEHGTDDAAQQGRHELPPHQPRPEIGEVHSRGLPGMLRRGRTSFGTLAVLLCLLLGVAIATQVRETPYRQGERVSRHDLTTWSHPSTASGLRGAGPT